MTIYIEDLLLLLGMGAGVVLVGAYLFDELARGFRPPPPPPPPTVDDFDQDAALQRARARAIDAQAAYDDSRAKAALKRAELLEVEQFVREQQSKRAGNGRR